VLVTQAAPLMARF